jgi:alternate signal-mediated exported protein
MNKMIKGSVAGATGIVLLMGGFGTYALWSDSEDLQASGVESGELDIAPGSTAVWDDHSTTAPGDWNPGTDLVVPGDVITRTQTFDVRGYGKNLSGTITFNPGTVDKGGFASAGPQYDWLDVDVEITSPDAQLSPVQASATDFTFSSPFESATLTAVVTYTVGDATAQQAQDATATLDGSSITIAQN